MIQILNNLLLDFITFINEKSKELCAYVFILHVLEIDCVRGYGFCKRLLVLIKTVPCKRFGLSQDCSNYCTRPRKETEMLWDWWHKLWWFCQMTLMISRYIRFTWVVIWYKLLRNKFKNCYLVSLWNISLSSLIKLCKKCENSCQILF